MMNYILCALVGAFVGIIFRELWVLRQRKRDEDRLAKYRPPVPPRVFSGDDGDMNGGAAALAKSNRRPRLRLPRRPGREARQIPSGRMGPGSARRCQRVALWDRVPRDLLA